MLFVESLLLLEEWQLPVWLFPYHTTHDIVSYLHRLFPVFINCTRVVTGAFHVDHRVETVKRLNDVVSIYHANMNATTAIFRKLEASVLRAKEQSQRRSIDDDGNMGIMEMAMNEAENSARGKKYLHMTEPLKSPIDSKANPNLLFFRNLSIYIIAYYLYSKYRNRSN
jgi:hypothetical protein